MGKKKICLSTKIKLGIVTFSTLFLIVCLLSTAFSDWYTNNIFPIWINTYGRFTSLFSFSFGEKLIFIGLILLALFIAALFYLLISFIIFIFQKKKSKKYTIPGFIKRYFDVFTWILSFIYLIMNLNCFSLYHCTQFECNYTYTLEELTLLRDHIVNKLNEYALIFERDELGNIIYTEDIGAQARISMQNLDGTFSRMNGFQVIPKTLDSSVLMSQQYMQGYYFPFSMEANINGLMSIGSKPFTMCHELAHTRGYIYEDEANLIGFFACIKSDDVFFQYSGYLSVLNYVNNTFYRSVDIETYKSHVAVSDLVWHDDEFLTEEAWEYVNSHALFSTEKVKKAADTFVDTTLKVNGVKEGKLSYNHVVDLLLTYYDYKS
ncbi:Protein of unknown function [Butyrivibrio fibrisolvens DSM 3071]|uniref:DUF3810 domain-containing protein n=1 Tax=Butyrivibrio fibrisolvens DSM 3071 TaxID=1121131 RepID=A0A1M5YL48_BUTFI|nr:DUF3810 domain-containing protein [Butyrivibrio fibrisolvens]SHI12711.1 Protein of unknown function [Butyrivibrio fibrisolvens DSM 3071]